VQTFKQGIGDTLHNRVANLSLATAFVAVVVISVSLLQVLPIPFPSLRVLKETPTMHLRHPQCNTLCLVAVLNATSDV
jgi:hypothetical protein